MSGLNEKLAKEAAEFANMAVVDDDHEWFVQRTFSAINYYLTHRPAAEQFRDAARILRSGCEPGVEDSRWSPSELEAHADALEERADADALARDVGLELLAAIRESPAIEDHVARLLSKFTITRREVS